MVLGLNSLSAANHSCFQSKNFLSVAMTQYHNSDKVTGRSHLNTSLKENGITSVDVNPSNYHVDPCFFNSFPVFVL